jgi:hypothetical protein
MEKAADRTFNEILAGAVGKWVNLKLLSGETIEGKLSEAGKDYCCIIRGERTEIFNIPCISRCVVVDEEIRPKKEEGEKQEEQEEQEER